MEILSALTSFYNAIAQDPRIGTTHISLYIALLQQWNQSGGKHSFQIKRAVIMRIAKISARHTYNKCINDLQNYGYITYKPAANVYSTSVIELRLNAKANK